MSKKIQIIILLLFVIAKCYTQNQKQISKNGFTKNEDYHFEIPFTYVNKHIFIEVTISDKKYTFLFDTGYEVSAIDLKIANEINYKLIKDVEISGSSVTQQKLSLIEIPSIAISNLMFEQTYGILQDLNFFSSKYENINVSGIIGNNLMRKTKWQIDYVKKVIRISDKLEKFDIPKEAKKIKLINKSWGLGYAYMEINKKKHKFIFDLGSNGKFTANHSFIKNINDNKAILKEEKQRFPLGSITIGEITLNEQSIVLEKNASSLIGNEFFENYLLTIDWDKNILYLNQNIE